ncbi:MAG TPA: FAD-binding oxidoreductase [Xanthobacteraceae bacterium]|nr:FAD-binding oxidoreductase [Xanthobacteraceae bacterium]
MQADDPISDGASWYAEATVPAPERPRLTFDLDVDVCVIGGGLAGLTTARELARRGWSVAVLEAQTVASGASGRNLGFVLPGFLESLDRIVERVGLEHAKELWALSERGLEYVRETIRETKMPGVEPVNGWLSVAKFREDPRRSEEARLLREEFGAQAEAWPAEQVREQLKSPLYQNAIHFPRAFHIHPMNYAIGLAAAAEQAGVRIFEHTPALSLDPAGIRKRIGTASARVRAAQVVLAGNTGLGALMPRLAMSLLPITTYVATTAPLGEKLNEAMSYKGGVSDSAFADSHYRIIGGDRLMWAGGMTMWPANPKHYARRLAADIRRAYPQLGRVTVDHVWSGTLGRAVHKMPQIGEMARGVWVASGFGGHGFNTTAMAADLIARGIVEGDQTWRLFSPYDLVWAGGAGGRAAAQALYWTRRIRERLDAQFSRPADLREDFTLPAEAAAPRLAGKAAATPAAAENPLPPAGDATAPKLSVAELAAAPASQASEPVAADETIVSERRKKPGRRRKPAAPKKSNTAGSDGRKGKAGGKIAPDAEPPSAADGASADS